MLAILVRHCRSGRYIEVAFPRILERGANIAPWHLDDAKSTKQKL